MENATIEILELLDRLKEYGYDVEDFREKIDDEDAEILLLEVKDFAMEQGIIDMDEDEEEYEEDFEDEEV